VTDLSQAHKLLHGAERTAHADAGYQGVERRAEIIASHGQVEWLALQPLTHAETAEQIELIAREVIPRLKAK